MTQVSISDVSNRKKTGLKGPNAVAWLSSNGIEVPAKPNTWARLPGNALIGRLGEMEFFIEEGPAAKVETQLREPSRGVYAVPRQDTCFALSGSGIQEVLLQTCSIDFRSQSGGGRLFLTSMVGVPVLVIPEERDDEPTIRIWADPTFGPYLWRTLSGIVQELTGGRK